MTMFEEFRKYEPTERSEECRKKKLMEKHMHFMKLHKYTHFSIFSNESIKNGDFYKKIYYILKI